MSRTRVAAAVLAAVVAWSGTARGEDPPKDEAARRAAIAKLGRLAWSGKDQPLEFCDLDGTNVVTTQTPPVISVQWLPDGKRVLAAGGGTLFVVDAMTGKATDVAPDRGREQTYGRPVLSPDAAFALARHADTSRQHGDQAVGYAVFDLASGKRCEIAPAAKEDWLGGLPPAWWAPDGTIVAVLGTTPETLVRFEATGRRAAVIATAPEGCRIRHAAFDADRIAYTVERPKGVEVRDAAGATLFETETFAQPTVLVREKGGTALRLELIAYDSHVEQRWRLAPGRPPQPLTEPDVPQRVRPAGANWVLTTRTTQTPVEGGDPLFTTELLRVDDATRAETDLGPGSTPFPVGDVFVYWRVTVPNKPQPGPFFEYRRTIQGTDDLWAYDPKDGAVIRLTDRGFTARSWDIAVTPPASRPR